MLVVTDGRIAAVGRADEVAIPAGATVRDLAGKVVLPGLVDNHSHLGRGSGADSSAPLQPEVRILDAIDVRSPNLWKALAGRRVVHFHTHRHDDIATVIRLAAEFGIRPVLHHLAGGEKMAAAIAASGLPASIMVTDAPGGKLEALDASWRLAGVLERAGVEVAIHTDDAASGCADDSAF